MSNTNQVTLEDALTIAKEHHKAGNLTLADTTYRDILKVLPNEFNSLHYLAVLAYQRGNPDEGIEFIKQAVTVKDDFADSWNAYAVMLAQVGKGEEAVEKWKKAIKLRPNFPEALSNLGNSYWELGLFDESLTACKKAVELKPDYADAYINLGNAYTGVGDPEKAIETWKKAIELQPINPNAYINIGNALRDLGKIKESGEYCEIALEQSSNHPKALLNLANVKRDLGDLSEAEALYKKATQEAPDFLDAHNNLAITLMDQSKFEEAITSIKFALVIDSQQSQAYSNLAAALRETGKLKEAEEAARKAIILDPETAEARIELADILFASERLDEAETLINEAMDLIPDNPRLYIKLATILEHANRIDDAMVSIDKAIELSPQMPEGYHKKGLLYYVSNRIEEALKYLEKALKLNPKATGIIASKSEILQTKGDMEKAENVAREGLAIDPNQPFLYFTLSKLKKFTSKDDPDLIKMNELAKNIKDSGNAQATALHFSLFKAYENIKDYDSAFKHLKKANDLKHARIFHDKKAQSKAFAKIKETYTKDFIDKFDGKGSSDTTPIFIVGMPRSGTTLTEQIISSHPDVYGAGELFFLTTVETDLGAVNEQNCKEMGELYVERVRGINDESKIAKHITDKMPGNFIRLGQIAAALPNAKIIHCKRNPMDTCLSCYKQLFAHGQFWSYNIEDMVEHYELYMDVMEHWKKVMPERFLEVTYEDTVEDFENQARKLIDYVGLEWNDACLTPHKQKRAILTASKAQVRKPIYKTSVEAWKRYEEQLQDLAKPLQKFVGK